MTFWGASEQGARIAQFSEHLTAQPAEGPQSVAMHDKAPDARWRRRLEAAVLGVIALALLVPILWLFFAA